MKIYHLAALILLTGCTTSLHQVTGTLRTPVAPDQVMVYHAMPENSAVIGTVSAVSFGGITLRDAQHHAMDKVKLESGYLGANGIVIDDSDDEALCGAQVQGEAIFVSQ